MYYQNNPIIVLSKIEKFGKFACKKTGIKSKYNFYGYYSPQWLEKVAHFKSKIGNIFGG